MPIVQEAILDYIDTWNFYTIYKQATWLNSVLGQPKVLYNIPLDSVNRYKISIDPEFTKKIKDSIEE